MCINCYTRTYNKYNEACLNQTLSKPETCLNQTNFTVLYTEPQVNRKPA